MTCRPGASSLAELVLVCWAFALVLVALAEFVAGQGRLARRQSSLVRLQEARRTIEVVLGAEVRALTAADLSPQGPGSVAVRAARGSGPVCAVRGRGVEVRYTGARWPDPGKDSLVVIGAQDDEVLAVTGVRAGGCDGMPGALTITLDRAPGRATGFAFVFEPGSYHAHDRAIRYRLGRAGRQPLTEAVFDATGLVLEPAGAGLRIVLRPDADSLPSVDGPLALRFHSLNDAVP